MTYEEALKLLENIGLYLVRKTSKPLNVDFVNTLKKALEKQIPKKPIERFALMDMRKCCPVCGDVLCRPYPCTCGQMIDWRSDVSD